jgi:hypothetical protein
MKTQKVLMRGRKEENEASVVNVKRHSGISHIGRGYNPVKFHVDKCT